jgi:hypothetical protein
MFHVGIDELFSEHHKFACTKDGRTTGNAGTTLLIVTIANVGSSLIANA